VEPWTRLFVRLRFDFPAIVQAHNYLKEITGLRARWMVGIIAIVMPSVDVINLTSEWVIFRWIGKVIVTNLKGFLLIAETILPNKPQNWDVSQFIRQPYDTLIPD
jgi:hypothetical protein